LTICTGQRTKQCQRWAVEGILGAGRVADANEWTFGKYGLGNSLDAEPEN